MSAPNGAVGSYGWFSTSDRKGGKVPIDSCALFGSGSFRGGLAWKFFPLIQRDGRGVALPLASASLF